MKNKSFKDEEMNEEEHGGEKKPSIMIMIALGKKNESDREKRAKKISKMLKGEEDGEGSEKGNKKGK